MQTAFFIACVLLLLGFVVRAKFKLIQILYIPAAVLGGLIGFVVIALGYDWIPQDTVAELRKWPGWLITVIFAGLLIERPGKSLRESIRLAAREGIVVWIIVLGEITVGLLVTWFVVLPLYKDVPASFGQLIEAGFAGGHGTAGALGDIYERVLSFPDGRDLAFFFATVGLIFGVVSGIVYINIAVRRGWTRAGDVKIPLLSGLEARKNPQPIAYARVRSEVIDPLVFQALILTVAIIVGVFLRWSVLKVIPATAELLSAPKLLFHVNLSFETEMNQRALSERLRNLFKQELYALSDSATVSVEREENRWRIADEGKIFRFVPAEDGFEVYGNPARNTTMRYAGNLPLFMFTLIGGLLVREAMHLFKMEDLIDPEGMRRITGAAMEFLIVAAIASLKVSALVKFGWPILLLLLLAFIWTGIGLFVIARHLLPKAYWFELGILNYGMSTGTTAQGLMLLRIIDKDLESGAAEDYALAAPLSAPFIGGGIITLLVLPLLLENFHIGFVVVGLVLIMAAFCYVGATMARSDENRRRS